MKRRDFIGITATGAAAAVAPEVFYKSLWWLWGSEGFAHDWQEIPVGIEKFVATVCQQCQGGCGALVRLIGDRPIKMDGNPSNPVSRGSLCPKGQAALQSHYHPSRIKTPLRRVGERGSGEWESISWDEAINTVTSRLRQIRVGDGPNTVAFMDGEESEGLMKALIKRFMGAYGSPNYIAKNSAQSDDHLMHSNSLDGSMGFYDISKAKYVLSFGHNFIETFYSPLQGVQAYSNLREKEAKMAYAGSRLSITGIKSNKWVKVNPNTEGMLAIGIAQVIIRENLFNRNFVLSRTSKFEEFERAVMDFSIHEIHHSTGVRVDDIEDLAREFAASKESAVAIGNGGKTADQVAINSLNLLTGNIARLWWNYDKEAIPFTAFPDLVPDSTAQGGLTQRRIGGEYSLAQDVFGDFSDNVLNRSPYSIGALFVYYSNPLLSVPNTDKIESALKRIPFIVNFSPFMDETAQLSDIILPDNSPLERWQDAPQTLIDGTPVLSIRQPVVEKLHNTMSTADVILRIAQQMGGSVKDALPWGSFKDLLTSSLEGVFNSGEGTLTTDKVYTEFGDWFNGLIESAWQNPDRRSTFEGVAQFYPELISSVSRGVAHSEEYPFNLNVYKLMTLTKPRNTAQPTLFDIAAPHIRRKWVAWVEINPETAHELHIEDEDWVWVESVLGRERFKAKLYEGTMPEVVNIPLIIGSRGYEPWLKDGDQKILKIVNDSRDDMDGHNLYDTRVKIYKV